MKKLSVLLLLTSMFFSCNKDTHDNEKCKPKCIDKQINDFKISSTCDNANVKEYTFQGKTVFTFDPGACGADFTVEVINSDCNSLGHLGGKMGNTKINGEEFSNATFIKTTWEK